MLCVFDTEKHLCIIRQNTCKRIRSKASLSFDEKIIEMVGQIKHDLYIIYDITQ